MKKLFSVLIPVYNVETNIESLVDSFLRQDRSDIEIIMLNDGSTDGSLEVMNKLAEENPEKIRIITRENAGAVRTRRELFLAASGEWIWIPDSDDGITEGALDFLRKAINDYDADMFMFDHYCVYPGWVVENHQLDRENGAVFSGEHKKELYKDIILRENTNMLWNKIFKRECVDLDADYTEYYDVKRANDKLQMLPILSNAKKIVYLRKPLYRYNIIDGSLCRTFKSYTAPSLIKVEKRMEEYIKLWDLGQETEDKFSVGVCLTACMLIGGYITSTSIENKDIKAHAEYLLSDSLIGKKVNSTPLNRMPKKQRKEFRLLKERKFDELEKYIIKREKRIKRNIKIAELFSLHK